LSFQIKTPHSAIIVWNYVDRLGAANNKYVEGTSRALVLKDEIISIQTQKSKSDPEGQFQFVLAPNRDWIKDLIAGSWCAILISNDPISQKEIQTANSRTLKMIGKINSVRVSSSISDTGEKNVNYLVSGVDWGHIFNNILFVNTNLAGQRDRKDLKNDAAEAIFQTLFDNHGGSTLSTTASNIAKYLKIMGRSINYENIQNDINVLAKATYEIDIPPEMRSFLDLSTTSLNNSIDLKTGKLSLKEAYKEINESYTLINPFTLQGTNTFLQAIVSVSNPILNECFNELTFYNDRMKFTLFNRIKPFAVPKSSAYEESKNISGFEKLVSPFTFLPKTYIEKRNIININAGTNWLDKYNYIEIKPNFIEDPNIETIIKDTLSTFDIASFKREGFRPLIVNTDAYPASVFSASQKNNSTWVDFKGWTALMRSWYFDTHKMLNGTITLVGVDSYIPVGTNLEIDSSVFLEELQGYCLCHIENVSHNMSINNEGAKAYTTTINFVRGIFTDKNGNLITENSDNGAIDQQANNPNSPHSDVVFIKSKIT